MFTFTSLYDKVGFPGLGIKDFNLDSVAFSIGDNIQVRWYAICIVLGILAAVFYTYFRAKRHGLIFDDIIDLAFCAVIPGIIGARLYYVIFDYLERPEIYTSFIDVIAIWNGGLAIYGGLIFGVIGVVVAMKIKKIRVLTLLDCGFPGVLLAQSIGRWGNFFNMEAHGSATDLFCRMRLSTESGLTAIEVHPTFLYESFWNLVGVIVLTLITKKRKFDGQIFLMSVAWYGLGRAFIEGLRTDSLMLGSVRISQALATTLFVVSLTILIVAFANIKGRRVARCIYTSQSKKYVPYECKEGLDPDYDYDIDMLYTKNKAIEATQITEPDVALEVSENPEGTPSEVSEEASDELAPQVDEEKND